MFKKVDITAPIQECYRQRAQCSSSTICMEKKTLQLVNFHFVTSLSLANHVFVPTICMGNRLEKKVMHTDLITFGIGVHNIYL